MATVSKDVTHLFKPRTSNVHWEPSDQIKTTAPWKYNVLVFDDTSTRDGADASILIPRDYVGNPKLRIRWSTGAITGDVELDHDYRNVGGNDTESLNQAGTQRSINQNDTAPSAAHELMEVDLVLTAADFAAGDVHQCTLFRDKTDAGDTISAQIYIEKIEFVYDDA